MKRTANPERAQRLNMAVGLLKSQTAVSKIAKALMKKYNISKRQAYRYVQEAQQIGKEVPVPDHKMAFTVKISRSLIRSLRQYANSTGKTLSEIATQALETFLQSDRERG
jgi:predicted DNA-binding transcriptional regulator YafY